MNLTEGIYVNSVTEDGAANDAGIKPGDVITNIDGQEIKTEPKFRELIGTKRPGEKIKVTIDRGGKLKDYSVILRNRDGGNSIIKKVETKGAVSKLGIKIKELTKAEKEEVGLRNGVRVEKVFEEGSVARDTDIRDGFIITRVGNIRVDSEEEFKSAIEESVKNKEDGVLICGVYENVSRNFCYGLTL